MTSGFDEFSLALFTTLAPGGVVAFICLALILSKPCLETDLRTRINRYLALPIAIALVGFIASATHLGTPANALHVFSGIGRSPLSNEVLSAIAFLLFAGSYWMMAFKERFPLTLARLWIAAAAVAGIIFIAMTSLAYSVNTVPTWNTLFTPTSLVLSALFTGPLLALLTTTCATYESTASHRILFSIACLAFVAGTVVLIMQNDTLPLIANFEVTAAELVPRFSTTILIYAALGALGLLCAGVSFVTARTTSRRTYVLQLLACLCAFGAVLLTRIDFYQLHMTVGF